MAKMPLGDIGNAFVRKTPELYVHDADGNLTADGRSTYTWDGENRLTSILAYRLYKR